MKRLSALLSFALLFALFSTPAAAAFLDATPLIDKIVTGFAVVGLIIAAFVYYLIDSKTRGK